MALYAISDIHGYYSPFKNLLEEIGYSPSRDQLVVLGDLIDRGPDSRKVVELCMELQQQGTVILMGNHEQTAVSCLDPNEPKIISLYKWVQYCGVDSFVSNYVIEERIGPVLYTHIE
jgi:serine/threonine protein phosphatase 1